MQFETFGNSNAPALVCIPGLLGGPEDFRNILEALEKYFFIIILDPNNERRQQGLANLTEEVMKEISFNSTSGDIDSVLLEVKKEKAYLLGISLGGKIVYDFAIKYPHKFLGGVITDVGPGSFEQSDLYKFVDKIVQEINLNLTWPELKLDLQKKIPDRSMRSLIQTQISYPQQKPPGSWKTAMKNFREMLRRQSIDNQFEDFKKVDSLLQNEKSYIQVLHSGCYSGISAETLQLMQSLKSIKISMIPGASHFIHVTHKPLIQEKILNMLALRQ